MNLAQYYSHYGPMMDGHDGSWVGAVFGLLFFILIAVVILYVVRSVKWHQIGSGQTRDPVDIAKERYAKGEITKEELAEIKNELK